MRSLEKQEKRLIAFVLLVFVLALAPFVLGARQAPEKKIGADTVFHEPLVVRADTWSRLENLSFR